MKPEEKNAFLHERKMHGQSPGVFHLAAAILIWMLYSCAMENPASRALINDSNYDQIAALALAIIRLPEEAALAGYFTVHEDPEVACDSGSKVIHPLGVNRVQVFYEACDFENITWDGGLALPDDDSQRPYQILFGSGDREFGFYQTDSTYFAPFAEQVGFTFKGDLSVNHKDQLELFSGSILDIHFKNNYFDDLYTFRDMAVRRSFDSDQGHHRFAIRTEISSDLIPAVDCDVLTRFERMEDQYPYKGKMRIISVQDGSHLEIEVLSQGTQLILKLDSDNDDDYESVQSVTWIGLKKTLPEAYQALFSYYWHS